MVPDLVGEAGRILGSKLKVVEDTREDETPVRFHSSARGCKMILELGAFIPFEDGLTRYLEWLKSPGGLND
jgi:hypothetical protein